MKFFQKMHCARMMKSNLIKRAHSTFILSFGLCLLLTTGCQLDAIRPVPPLNRHGEYYFLAKHYGSSSVSFQLWGKALCNQDAGKFVILPSPSAIIPGIPLCLAEHYIICPVIDTLFLPFDYAYRVVHSDEEHILANGFYVQVMDVYGRPVANVTVYCWPMLEYDGLRALYNGEPTQEQVYFAKTDENGEMFVPIDATTCRDGMIGAMILVKSAQGGYFSSYYERGYRHPPYMPGGYHPRPEIKEAMKSCVDPDESFPKRDGRNVLRLVLEPELVYDEKKQAHWKFMPNPTVPLEDDVDKVKAHFGQRPIQIDEKFSPANL